MNSVYAIKWNQKQKNMNRKNHIQELEKSIERIKEEPVKGWIKKLGKSWKISKIENKIQSLKKDHNKSHRMGYESNWSS